VNCVAPGWVATPMSAAAMKIRASAPRCSQRSRSARVATPEEIAAPNRFLCTGGASFITAKSSTPTAARSSSEERSRTDATRAFVDARLRESSRARATRRRPTTFARRVPGASARARPKNQGADENASTPVRDAVPCFFAFINT